MAIEKPNLTRIWAKNADQGDVIDPDSAEPNKFEDGWVTEIPPFEYFNFLHQLFTLGLGHINQQGIGIWDSDTLYPVGGIAKGSDGWLYECVQENSGNEPTGDDGTFWIIYYKNHDDVLEGRFDPGTRMVFGNATAPTGWTQITSDLADDRMLRIVATAGGGSGGSDNPIVNDKVPSHTHTVTGTAASNGSHTHELRASGGNARVVGNTGTGASSSGPGANYSVVVTSNRHVTWDSGAHTHTVSGTASANSSAANWQPRYINLILCEKD